jgi:cytochrome c oxidase cbb3-type subunit 3
MSSDDNKKKIDQLRPSSYDGIQEYDNDLPRWWVWIFYLTGIYGVICLIGVYGFGVNIPPLPYDPAGGAVAVASVTPASAASQDDEVAILKTVIADASRVAKGKEVYDAKCVACHGAQGGGIVGPNLTDDFWIHGGQPIQIEQVIENGVLDKGMLSWKSMMSKDDIRSVVAFIRSIKGTNPPGAKEPQGEKVVE